VKKYFVFIAIFMFVIPLVVLSEAGAQEYKKLGKVYKINPNRDIIIRSRNASHQFKTGDKVYIVIDGRAVVMTVDLSVMTIAKCRLNSGYEDYFHNIYKGLQVYGFEGDVENRTLTDNDSYRDKIGDSSIIVTAAGKARMYYLNSDDWESILNSIMNSYGKARMDSDKIKSETFNAIRNPKSNQLQIDLSDIAYTIGDTGEKTPGIIKNLNDGNYYVWIVYNNEISVRYVSLKRFQNLILDFVPEKTEYNNPQNETVKQTPEDENQGAVGMDWGVGANVPFYDQKDIPYYSMNWIFTLLNIRINVFFDLRFNISDYFSLGFETGIYFMPNVLDVLGFQNSYAYSVTSIYTAPTVFYLDVPLRGFIRFGSRYFYGQIFGGYYLGIFPLIRMSNLDYYERGGELGGRLNLHPEANNIGHFKVGMGYTRRIF
jgi:hypothetical protein